jgi:transcriptional regulator GlxA family with amidase domain
MTATTPTVQLLVFDGFADWEPAYALAELRRSGGYEVETVGFTTSPVRSMGGLRIQPDRALAALAPDRVRLFLLPGGDMWEDPAAYPRAELEGWLRTLERAGVPIAAICAGTLAVARAGLLDDRRHTSNGESYLRQLAAGFEPGGRYDAALAVRDRGVITASGVGPTEFACAIFGELGVFDEGDRTTWYRLFKYGEMPAGAG